MAKKSKIARNEQRKEIVARYAEKRAALKKALVDPNSTDEEREAAFPSLKESVKISDKELELSASLVESFSSDFEPDQFVDEYQKELKTLIAAKLEKGDAIDTDATFGEQEEEGGEVIDLMEALRASVERSRKSRGKGEEAEKEDAKEDEPDEKPAKPKRKRTTKKAS